MYKYSDNHETGEVTTFYPSGSVKIHVETRFEKEHGVQTEYYENGDTLSVAIVKNGLLDGAYIKYFHDGGKAIDCVYRDGHPCGLGRIYREDGSIASLLYYTCRNGEIAYRKNFDIRNMVISEEGSLISDIGINKMAFLIGEELNFDIYPVEIPDNVVSISAAILNSDSILIAPIELVNSGDLLNGLYTFEVPGNFLLQVSYSKNYNSPKGSLKRRTIVPITVSTLARN